MRLVIIFNKFLTEHSVKKLNKTKNNSKKSGLFLKAMLIRKHIKQKVSIFLLKIYKMRKFY